MDSEKIEESESTEPIVKSEVDGSSTVEAIPDVDNTNNTTEPESADIVTDGATTADDAEVEKAADDAAAGEVSGEAGSQEEETKEIVETMASEEIQNEQQTEEGGDKEDKTSDQWEADNSEQVEVLPQPEATEDFSKMTGDAASRPSAMEPISEEADGEQRRLSADEETDRVADDLLPPERLPTRSPTDMEGKAGEGEERQGIKMDSRNGIKDEERDMVDDELPMAEKVPDRESLIEFYQQAMKDREGLLQDNTTLQNKLAEYFRRKRSEEGGPPATARAEQVDRSVSDLEQRYLSFMTNLEELQSKQKESKENYESEIAAIKSQCEQKEGELDRMTAEFVEKRRQIALKAINSRTGKPLQKEEIEAYILNEQKKDQEVKAVRLENIKLKNRLQKREKQLKQKEELAEGLHLIDFEQLKIENQTYNEKIEERNEELSKLRKKITNTVEVLTHLKEKLQYIQQENGQLNQQLKGLDSQVAQKRDALTKIKQNRDALRNENHELNRKCGLLGNETLLRDYEEKFSESSELKAKLAELKNRHTELAMKCTGYKKKIDQARAGIMIQ